MEPGWRKTWEDGEEDYVYCDGAHQLGRVYIHNTGGIIDGKWRWFYSSEQGVTKSRREAMLAVEEAYERRRLTGDPRT